MADNILNASSIPTNVQLKQPTTTPAATEETTTTGAAQQESAVMSSPLEMIDASDKQQQLRVLLPSIIAEANNIKENTGANARRGSGSIDEIKVHYKKHTYVIIDFEGYTSVNQWNLDA